MLKIATAFLEARECRRCTRRCSMPIPSGVTRITIHRKRKSPAVVELSYGPDLALSSAGRDRLGDLLEIYSLAGWVTTGRLGSMRFALARGSTRVTLDTIVDVVRGDLLAIARSYSVTV
jgi:hypothetical protein